MALARLRTPSPVLRSMESSARGDMWGVRDGKLRAIRLPVPRFGGTALAFRSDPSRSGGKPGSIAPRGHSCRSAHRRARFGGRSFPTRLEEVRREEAGVLSRIVQSPVARRVFGEDRRGRARSWDEPGRVATEGYTPGSGRLQEVESATVSRLFRPDSQAQRAKRAEGGAGWVDTPRPSSQVGLLRPSPDRRRQRPELLPHGPGWCPVMWVCKRRRTAG